MAIIEDDAQFRGLLGKTVERVGDYDCVGLYGTAEEALELLPWLKPGLVVVDAGLPGMDGVEGIRRLGPLLPGARFLLITGAACLDRIRSACAAGAHNYLPKPFLMEQFLAMLAFVRGANSPAAAAGWMSRDFGGLTDTETALMKCFARGLLYKEAAEELGMSQSMIHKHQHSAYEKLRAGNRTEAIERWRRISVY